MTDQTKPTIPSKVFQFPTRLHDSVTGVPAYPLASPADPAVKAQISVFDLSSWRSPEEQRPAVPATPATLQFRKPAETQRTAGKWYSIRFFQVADTPDENIESFYCEATIAQSLEAAEMFDERESAMEIARVLQQAYWAPSTSLLDAGNALLFKLSVLASRTELTGSCMLEFTRGMRIQVLEVTEVLTGWKFDVVWEDAYEWIWEDVDAEDEDRDDVDHDEDEHHQ